MYTNEEAIKIKTGDSLKKIKIWKSKIVNKLIITIRKNKFLIATMSAFLLFSIDTSIQKIYSPKTVFAGLDSILLFSIANAMMICTFFKILQRV